MKACYVDEAVATRRWFSSKGRPWQASGLLRLVMAAIVVCGVFHAGGRYFYCEARGLSLTNPCARAIARSSHEPSTLRPEQRDCCALLALRAMPDGATVERAPVPPAPAVALVPAPLPVDGVALARERTLRRAFLRWRIPPKPLGEALARRMAFLT